MIVSDSHVHPIDFESLKKGDVVPGILIAKAKNVKLSDPNYRLAQMSLKKQIEDECPDLYPRCVGQDIAILSDAEADQYNSSRFADHVKGMTRDSRRRTRIDSSGFDENAKRAAESRDRSFAGIALMSKKALRKANKEASLLCAPKQVLELTDGE